MTAPVRIEAIAFSDPRYELLGRLAGYSRFEALGRMAHLWSVCTARNTPIVTDAWVEACLGAGGVQAIVGAELGERVEGGVRVRGATDDRIGWYAPAMSRRKEAAKAAGKARAASAARGADGRLSAGAPLDDAGPASPPDKPPRGRKASDEPASDQRPTSDEPAPDHRRPASRARARARVRDRPQAKTTTVLPSAPPPSPDHPVLIAEFDRLYAEANAGARPTWGARQGKLVAELLKAHGLEECRRRAANMFRAPPPWPPPPHDLGTLAQHFDRFATPYRPPPTGERYHAVRDRTDYPDPVREREEF